jgi:hypothetical protein
MNLKEAFRYQNKLQALMDEAQSILCRDSNVTRVETTYLRKKVMAEAENETTVDIPGTEYAEQITEVAGFMLWLLGQRESLRQASCGQGQAARRHDMRCASQQRQSIAAHSIIWRSRSSEVLVPHGGTGYRFKPTQSLSYSARQAITTSISTAMSSANISLT